MGRLKHPSKAAKNTPKKDYTSIFGNAKPAFFISVCAAKGIEWGIRLNIIKGMVITDYESLQYC